MMSSVNKEAIGHLGNGNTSNVLPDVKHCLASVIKTETDSKTLTEAHTKLYEYHGRRTVATGEGLINDFLPADMKSDPHENIRSLTIEKLHRIGIDGTNVTDKVYRTFDYWIDMNDENVESYLQTELQDPESKSFIQLTQCDILFNNIILTTLIP